MLNQIAGFQIPLQQTLQGALVLNKTILGVSAAIHGIICKEYVEYHINKPSSPSSHTDLQIFNGQNSANSTNLPSFFEIYKFVNYVFYRARLEPECLIAALIYIQNLLQAETQLHLTIQNWERVTYVCLMIASKMWDDISCSSKGFCKCSEGSISQEDLNSMERFALQILNNSLYITAETYRIVYYDLKKIW
ncbi:MAG: putative Cyclin fold protein, partial [Streblomastix strix]